ncbi:iron-containing alcohol dehydrogenase family protein [Amycolatopsis sp. 195334CR]|uniref:iron-containing alcohol dehydrogenase family protein n=1 Tax=Amycolatopsis sp. 195334CR TaxID=2814588 RepID=UPI001A906F09|nr:iron-containing alcohol dehydrogenase [Amycolatopsis sp. 195334CR]MBN6042094.1 iron-containing alcohol dehydrogenase [Amycolatopsis sp. 195334CR]
MAVGTLSTWSARELPEIRVGAGALGEVGASVSALGLLRPLVVADPGVTAAGWPGRVVTCLQAAGLRPRLWSGARPDPDTEVVHRCRDELDGHDGIVAVGGGSTIDAAKAAAGLSVHSGQIGDYEGLGRFTAPGVPVVAVLTTPGSGAELSRHATIADGTGRKFAVSGRWLAPKLVLADPDALATLPAGVAADTALDALLHAIEAYLARAATAYSDVCARLAVEILRDAMVPGLRDGLRLMTGCLTAGMAMANTNAGVVHALGYPLTSEYRIPHGRANALVAPAALRALAVVAPDRCAELGRLLAGTPDLADAFTTVRDRLGVAGPLAEYGVPHADLPRLAALATAFKPVLRNTRREFTEAELCGLYASAWTERRNGS